jgi:hypothetical protein
MKRAGLVLALAVAFCCVFTSLVQAGADDPVTEQWARMNLVNNKRAIKMPKWQILQPGTAKSVKWVTWQSNPRFAVYDNGTPTPNDFDDLVLDRATGLVWTRNTSLDGSTKTWHEARDFCMSLAVGNVRGFRLATIEEMYTLFQVDGFVTGTAGLWLNVPSTDGWWTDTIHDDGEPKTPKTLVVDEDEATFEGQWTYKGMTWDPLKSCYKGDYAESVTFDDGSSTATFINITTPPLGAFKVYLWWTVPSITPYASNAPFTVAWDGTHTYTFFIDQNSPSDMWYELPIADPVVHDDGQPLTVSLSNEANGYVVADAVKVVFEDYKIPGWAVYKAPAADSYSAHASTSALKNIWAVRADSTRHGIVTTSRATGI